MTSNAMNPLGKMINECMMERKQSRHEVRQEEHTCNCKGKCKVCKCKQSKGSENHDEETGKNSRVQSRKNDEK